METIEISKIFTKSSRKPVCNNSPLTIICGRSVASYFTFTRKYFLEVYSFLVTLDFKDVTNNPYKPDMTLTSNIVSLNILFGNIEQL